VRAGCRISGCGLQNNGSEIVKGQFILGKDFVDIIQARPRLQTYAMLIPINLQDSGHSVKSHCGCGNVDNVRPRKGFTDNLDAPAGITGLLNQSCNLLLILWMMYGFRCPLPGTIPVANGFPVHADPLSFPARNNGAKATFIALPRINPAGADTPRGDTVDN
jgi:hypothetical protein